MLLTLINKLEKIWKKIRPDRRLWVIVKYGEVIIKDNRTIKEKFRDFVDNIFIKIRHYKPKDQSARQVWHTYFDQSIGQLIDSYSKIKDIERSGYTYATFDEMEHHCAKVKQERKSGFQKRVRTGLEQKLNQHFQGKSFKH